MGSGSVPYTSHRTRYSSVRSPRQERERETLDVLIEDHHPPVRADDGLPSSSRRPWGKNHGRLDTVWTRRVRPRLGRTEGHSQVDTLSHHTPQPSPRVSPSSSVSRHSLDDRSSLSSTWSFTEVLLFFPPVRRVTKGNDFIGTVVRTESNQGK